MMRMILLAATAALSVTVPLQQARAWMHANAGGGYTHSGSAGGYQHSTTVSPEGVSHSSDAGGYEHGTAVGSEGAVHGSTAGGYAHGTAVGPEGAAHAGAYGSSYYHQPAVVNHYGASCYNCGGAPGWGGAAAGAAAGVAVGAAAAGAAYAASARPASYAALPGGCAYQPYAQAYNCGAMWLAPAYGANGVYYRVVPAP